MNEKTLRALVENGAIKKIRIIGSGARFHIELLTSSRAVIAETSKGQVKTWASLDGAAKWLKNLGVGSAELSFGQWQPNQKRLAI